jgi:hypothetical protein
VVAVGYGIRHDFSKLPGPSLSTEARAEIKRTASCDQLRAMARRYSPDADSSKDAFDAEMLIEKRLLAECASTPTTSS